MYIKQKTIDRIIAWSAIIIFEFLTYVAAHAQGVGIGISNPQATLHVAGTVRIDSVPMMGNAIQVLVQDTNHQIKSVRVDSLRNSLGIPTWLPVTVYSQEVSTQASTTSVSPQSRVTITLPAGTYILFAYAEIYSSGTANATRMWVHEGATEIAYAVPFSNTSTFGSWSFSKVVSPATTTTYTLAYGSFPAGVTSYIRRARLFAIRIS